MPSSWCREEWGLHQILVFSRRAYGGDPWVTGRSPPRQSLQEGWLLKPAALAQCGAYRLLYHVARSLSAGSTTALCCPHQSPTEQSLPLHNRKLTDRDVGRRTETQAGCVCVCVHTQMYKAVHAQCPGPACASKKARLPPLGLWVSPVEFRAGLERQRRVLEDLTVRSPRSGGRQ